MPVIRRARAADEKEVFTLFSKLQSRQPDYEYPVDQESGHSVFHKLLGDESLGLMLVAEVDESILGVITLSYPLAIRCSGHYARIEEYIVDEASRGMGLGGLLLDAAITEAKKYGCYDLQVNNPSDLGRPLYVKRGFHEGGDYMRLKL